MLALTRSRGGITSEEIEELRDAHQHFDRAKRGEISKTELGCVLRWMGYRPTLREQHALMEEVDVDRSGLLDFDELVQVVRRLREQEAARARKTFDAFDVNGDNTMAMDDLVRALRSQGFREEADVVDYQLASEGLVALDFDAFLQAVRMCREVLMNKLRKNSGFDDDEVAKYQWQFGKYDRDNSGAIERVELDHLFEDLFPAPNSGEQHVQNSKFFREAVAEADVDGDGQLEFSEVLVLMRRVEDMQEDQNLEMERLAIEETGFQKEEVESFRAIFAQADLDMSGDLDED